MKICCLSFSAVIVGSCKTRHGDLNLSALCQGDIPVLSNEIVEIAMSVSVAFYQGGSRSGGPVISFSFFVFKIFN